MVLGTNPIWGAFAFKLSRAPVPQNQEEISPGRRGGKVSGGRGLGELVFTVGL